MILTFLDTGVLIAALRAERPAHRAAQKILADTERRFASSHFVRLELLPMQLYFQNHDALQFYRSYFDAVSVWAHCNAALIEDAYLEASQAGLRALDALHIAAALQVGAEEFITSEGPGKPFFRVKRIKVTSLQSQSR